MSFGISTCWGDDEWGDDEYSAILLGEWWGVVQITSMIAVICMYLMQFKLEATLARTKVDRLTRRVARLDMETCTDDDSESKVRQPTIELAQTTLPALTRMGPAIGALACATTWFRRYLRS